MALAAPCSLVYGCLKYTRNEEGRNIHFEARSGGRMGTSRDMT